MPPRKHLGPSAAKTQTGAVESRAETWERGACIKLVHVSKAAGRTAKLEMPKFIAETKLENNFFQAENCFLATGCRKEKYDCKKIMFYRVPRHLVLSQYVFCAYSFKGKQRTNGTRFPRNDDMYTGFSEWIDYFSNNWNPAMGDFRCLNPHNAMARIATCTSCAKNYDPAGHIDCRDDGKITCNHHVGPTEDVSPSLTRVHDSINSTDLVGLVELYPESFCLFQYRLHGKLFPGCTCSESLPPHLHEDHGAPPHDVDEVGLALLSKIDKLTEVDTQAYLAAAGRLLSDLDHIEHLTGECLLRPERLADLQRTANYIGGFSELVSTFLAKKSQV